MARPHLGALPNANPAASAPGDTASKGATGDDAALSSHRHAREAFGSSAAAVGTSAAGSAATVSHSDHVHATGAGTPSTQAIGDAAATGSGPAAAMTDHKHAMPAYGTTAGTVAQGNDSRFTDARTPTAHHASHETGGSDIVAIDTIPGKLLLPLDESITISADTDNQALGATSAILRLTASGASRNLTGLTGGADGRIVVLMNVGSQDVVLKHDVTSTAANRFLGPNSADMIVKPNEMLVLAYDSTSSRWRISDTPIGGTPSTQAFGDSAVAGSSGVGADRDHKHAMPSERAASSTTPAAIGTAAVGTGTTDARSDHVHATGAGTPSTQAFGDAAATGSGPAAAMTDHKHAMPTGTAGPDANVTIDAAGAAGTANTAARSGHGHQLVTSTGTPLALGTAAAGTSGRSPSRDDHVHPTTGILVEGEGAARRFTSARYYGAQLSGNTTFTPTINVLMAVPIFIGRSTTIDRIAAWVQTAGASSNVLRLGAYDDSGGLPNNLLFDAGTVSSTTSGFKTITISQTVTGILWLACVCQVGTVAQLLGAAANTGNWTNTYIGVADPTVVTEPLGLTRTTTVSGALPSTFGAITDPASPIQSPMMWVRKT